MKLCLECRHSFAGADWACPVCGFAPRTIAGFPSFAQPAGGDGFRPEFFAELAELEARHFWFQGRNRLIMWALGKYFPGAASLLEVGCGTGFVLSGVAGAFPNICLVGSEYFAEGLPFAAARVPGAGLVQADARQLPYMEEFDVVCGFDVLEHIREDDQVLSQLHRAVRPGGGLLLTVPQHPWLWSAIDEHSCHVRRYTAAELQKKVEAAGFRVTAKSSFVSLLLPAMLYARRRTAVHESNCDPLADLRLGRLPNAVGAVVMALERRAIAMGLRLPVGGSLLLVAQRPV